MNQPIPVSPRNKIPCPRVYGGQDTYIEIDTLFEMCDAQFNSEKKVHDLFAACTKKGPQDEVVLTKRVTRAFAPLVMKASRSVDELHHMHYSDWNCEIVAGALARLWVKQYNTEQKLQKGRAK